MTVLQVRKDDIANTRIVPDEKIEIGDREVLLKIDRFAFTSNNITYGIVGERIGYWNFFPAEDGWGIIPVWGFADVIESRASDVPVGDRLYGYFPTASYLKIKPTKISPDRLVDGADHRAQLPPVYNSYARVGNDSQESKPLEHERMILFPLYATSYCLYDYLIDNEWFGAKQVIVSSASSKTAIGLGYAIASDKSGTKQIGLTSVKNKAFVQDLSLYDDVVTYDDLSNIDNSIPTVIIDMSGNGQMLAKLHVHLGDNMKYCSNVGLTHWDENKMGEGFIHDRSAMFFAPGHIQKRAKEWGAGIFENNAMKFWQETAMKSKSWLVEQNVNGLEDLRGRFSEIQNGKINPTEGLVVKL